MDVKDSDLAKLINERDHLRAQVTELQERCTELTLANRELKGGRKVSACCGAPVVQAEGKTIPDHPVCSKCGDPAGV